MRAWHRLAVVRSCPSLSSCRDPRISSGSLSQLSRFSTSPIFRDPTYDYDYVPKDSPNPSAKSIAVLGGGITGLVTAHRLAYFVPDAKITIFEASDRRGGWVDSERIDVGNGHILFEWGPRTLRRTKNAFNASAHTIALLDQLGLHDEVIPISPRAPAAVNRYIYYPDRLVRLPTPRPDWSVWQYGKALIQGRHEPLFEGFVEGLSRELGPWVRKLPIQNPIRDESIGDFVGRLMGEKPADNIVSAIFQGIYAGDIYKLSALTIMPIIKAREGRVLDGSVFLSMVRDWRAKEQLHLAHDGATVHQLRGLVPFVNTLRLFGLGLQTDASVYTFRRGVGQLAARLEEVLRSAPNIEFKKATASLEFDSDKKQFQVHDRSEKKSSVIPSSEHFDYVVSTLPPKQLSTALQGPQYPPYLQMLSEITNAAPAVTVMVVNLFYADPDLVPVEGFGYLIPRSIPAAQNPENALGVIFASQSSHGIFDGTTLDDVPPQAPRSQDTAPGTKLAVMLGGHWWDGRAPSDLPSESDGIAMARRVLERHLGITATPILAKARLQMDAIPQHTVGYNTRMRSLHGHLRREFGGKLKVAGPAWQGAVGVNDCVVAGTRAAFAVREGWDGSTGLEGFGEGVPQLRVWKTKVGEKNHQYMRGARG